MKTQSFLKQIVIGVTISLISAFLIYKFGWNRTKQIPENNDTQKGQTIKNDTNNESDDIKKSISELSIEIDWTNVKEYFVIKKPSLSKGFSRAPSIFQAIFSPKGTFTGVLQAVAFDEDQLKVCSLSGEEVGLFGTGCMSYDIIVMLQSSMFQDSSALGDPRFHFWQKGVSERVRISIPHNAVRLVVNFDQQF